MNKTKSIRSLRTRNLLIRAAVMFAVLMLPLFREQYMGGIYVTWFRPIDLIAISLQKPHQPALILMMVALLLLVDLAVSYLLFRLQKKSRRASK